MKRFICSVLLLISTSIFAAEQMATVAHTWLGRDYKNRIQILDKMQEAGVKWLRTDFAWWFVQKKDGSFDFRVLDELVDMAAKRDIKILPIITYFGFSNQGKIDAEKHPERWEEYIRKTVSHYKDSITHWEILNEHDCRFARDNKGNEYGKLLKRASEIIRKTNPKAKVVYGGVSSVNAKYIEDTLKTCPTEHFDIMNFHTYPAPVAPEGAIKFGVDTLNNLMKKYGGTKPIWITEIGSSTARNLNINLPELLDTTLPHLGIDVSKIEQYKVYALTDAQIGSSEDITKKAFAKNKVRTIKYSQISKIEDNAVLVMPISQLFPHKYAIDFVNFVKRGGTVLYLGGGYPFFYDSSRPMLKQGIYPTTMSKILNMMHIDMVPHWLLHPKMPGILDSKNAKTEKDFEKLNLHRGLCAFNFTAKKLKGNDKFIPLVSANVLDIDIVPSAIYKFDSDFKGGILLLCKNFYAFVSERNQCAFLARDYLFGLSNGVDKIFTFCFINRDNPSPYEEHLGITRADLTPKPAFHAFKFLGKILPTENKFEYNEIDEVHTARWVSPEGKNICAVWTFDITKKVKLKINNAPYKVFDMSGDEIFESKKPSTSATITASPTPRYIIQ